MKKPYLLFAFAGYYPEGGWNDFVSAHESYPEALAAFDREVNKTTDGMVQLVDLVAGRVVRCAARSNGDKPVRMKR